MRTSSIMYNIYIEMGERMGQPDQQLLNATEKLWRMAIKTIG
jgi:hypothetical protein